MRSLCLLIKIKQYEEAKNIQEICVVFGFIIKLYVDVYDLSNDFVFGLLHLRRLIQLAEMQIFLYQLLVVEGVEAFSSLWLQYFVDLALAQTNLTLKAMGDFQQQELLY
jgi:hypothetical protein